MGSYGNLPVTGAALTIGGVSFTYPWVAAAAAATVVAGFLILRFVKPAKSHRR